MTEDNEQSPELDPEQRGFLERMENWIDSMNKDKVGSPAYQYNHILTPYKRNRNSNPVVYDYYDYGGVGAGGVPGDVINRKSYPRYGYSVNYGGYGDYGHHHNIASYGSYCKEDQVNLALLATTILGIGIMWYTLWTKIMANGGRRKKRSSLNFDGANLTEILSLGK